MSPQASHFTTWDDPALWNRVTEIVTSPQGRFAVLHQAEATAPSATAGQEIDITDVLNQNGIPTSNARVSCTYDLANHSATIRIRNGGVNWNGTVRLEITKD